MYHPIEHFAHPSTLLCSFADNAAEVAMVATSKVASFPSQAAEYYYSHHQIFFVNRSIDFIGPHYILNGLMILVCVGFLSWSLDSSHGDVVKYIEPVLPKAPEEKPVENISSVDPKADRRRSILQRTRARRLTIENIAKMIDIEDQKRQEVFGSSPSPLDTSAEAMDMGIGGGDVGLNMWSLNQEMRLLKEIDFQLQKDGLATFANPGDEEKLKQKATTTTTTTITTITPSEKKPDDSKKDVDVTRENVTEDSENVPQVNVRPPYSMDSAKKMNFKARVLLKIRVPLRWVM